MARQLRIEYPGAVYHVMARGNNKKAVFEFDEAKELLLEKFREAVKNFGWICHNYCIMDNHYHFLIETPECNLAKGMKWFNGIYAQKYNYLYNRVGHLFQDRYKSFIVKKDDYMLTLIRYILLNPVMAGFVRLPGEWRWSSYNTLIGKGYDGITTNSSLFYFSNRIDEARKEFRTFVYEGILGSDPKNKRAGV